MLSKELYLDKRIIRTKNLLKEAFISLLQEKHFNDVSITDITAKANISRVTFYNHYQDKEKLLDELIDDIVTGLIYAYRNPYASVSRFHINKMTPTTVKLFDHVYQNAKFYTTIVNSDILPAFQNRIIMELNKLFIEDIRIRNPRINYELYAGYKAHAIVGMIIEWVAGEFKYSPQYMAMQLVEIVKLPVTQSLERKHNR